MTPYLAVLLIVIIGAWFVAAVKLNELFLAQSALKEKELADAEQVKSVSENAIEGATS